MHIEINDKTTVREIQGIFSDYYPYLRVDFYSKPHKKYESSDKAFLVSPGKKMASIKKTHLSGLIEIKPLDKIATLEKEFQQRFGLSVQVLVKQKDKWIQTTGMDDFTLKELNKLGRSSSDEFILSEAD